MKLADMTADERAVVGACLRAVVEGPFLNPGELPARTGLRIDELRAILDRWPDLDDSRQESNDWLAINNGMNEICHGVRFDAETWSSWFDVPRDEVKRVFRLWKDDLCR